MLSAMYGVTNKLLDAATSAGKGNVARVQKLRGELLDLHGGTAKGESANEKAIPRYVAAHTPLPSFFFHFIPRPQSS